MHKKKKNLELMLIIIKSVPLYHKKKLMFTPTENTSSAHIGAHIKNAMGQEITANK